MSTVAKLWPTPHGFSPDGRSNGPSGNELGRAVNRSMIPTPTSSMLTMQDLEQARYAGSDPRRPKYAESLFPTPCSTDYKTGYGDTPAGRAQREKRSKPLRDMIHMFRTPNASDADKWSLQSEAERAEKGQQIRLNHQLGAGGSLNPLWVEWLMGWPIGWTDLRPLATARFRRWCGSHGRSWAHGHWQQPTTLLQARLQTNTEEASNV